MPTSCHANFMDGLSLKCESGLQPRKRLYDNGHQWGKSITFNYR